VRLVQFNPLLKKLKFSQSNPTQTRGEMGWLTGWNSFWNMDVLKMQCNKNGTHSIQFRLSCTSISWP